MASKVRQAIEELFWIHNKEGILVPFRFNEIQSRIDEDIIEPDVKRASILKFRQGGVTTLVMAWFLVECMRKYTVAVMLAHDRDHTEKLLQRARLMLMHMNVKPRTSRVNDNEIRFARTNSTFYIGTAGSKNFGRSATITHLHCSEIAFWKDPKGLLVGLKQAIPFKSGTIIQETTGNGWGTWFQKEYYRYLEKKGGFKPCFYPWYIHQEYVLPSSTPLHLTPPEVELARKFDLTEDQLYWRRVKIDDDFEGDETFFNQEYPFTVEDAFRLTGGSLFSEVKRVETNTWEEVSPHLYIKKGHPIKGYTYVFGADSAGGTGNDNASTVGICLNTREQVLEYAYNRISPPNFAKLILAKWGKIFNSAYLVPETNSHGLSTLAVLKEIYPRERIYKHVVQQKLNSVINVPSHGYGWKTSSLTKPYMVGVAQRLLPQLALYSPHLVDELLSFTETEEGKLEGIGDHDDRAIAFMLACIGYLKLLRFGQVYRPITNLEPSPIPEGELVPYKPPRSYSKPSWRDEQGRLLVRADDTFAEREARKRKMRSFAHA